MNYAKNISNTIMHEACKVRIKPKTVVDAKGNIAMSINVTPRLLKKVRPSRAKLIAKLMKYEARAK